MVFSSHIFLFYFLPIFLIIYYILPFTWKKFYLRNSWITISSYVFYGWLVPWYIIPMLASTIWDYVCGKIITTPGMAQWKRKAALLTAIIGDLSLLAFFKYTPLMLEAVDKLNSVFGTAGTSYAGMWNIVLPAGISFYTFVALSYTIDLYRGEAKPAPNFPSFTCFIALFPHLIAGPVIRYSSVAEQLVKRDHRIDRFVSGLGIFFLGFAKKILLANSAGQIADTVFRANGVDTPAAWWGIIAYHFQIYFDFCGYSDMAVGLARMIGIEFPKNFNAPYHSKSLNEFWKKWHISLTNFIRDYIYFPLGGNRVTVKRFYFNLILVYFLSGLWHGAKVTFIIWGLFQAVFMILERLRGDVKNSVLGNVPGWVNVIFINVVVMFSWAIFRAPSTEQGIAYWGMMLGIGDAATATPLLHATIFTWKNSVMLLVCAFFAYVSWQAHDWISEKLSATKMVIATAAFILAVIAMFTQTYNPFLYFQF
ncbi:MAG: MBOAT family protein [Fibrobacteres bacterium]|nr:MBOAT family protein [Fibrobacterota bacterium]